MKRAIVLAGGGTKGAYQAGALKAIKELGIQFDIVTGTSIGALNGCLFCQDDLGPMVQMWENLTKEDIMKDGMDMKFTIDNLMEQTDLIKPFLKSYISNKGADIEPLKQLVYRMCNEEKLKQHAKQFGLVTVEYPAFKPLEITYAQMNGKIQEYLIASASCFPAFPVHELNGHGYIDGGYFDNLPIDLAFQMGAEEVIAIELTFERHTHPNFENRPNIHYIRPSQYTGQFLDFSSELSQFRLKLGYNDAMKQIGPYLGDKYTFYPDYDSKIVHDFYYDLLMYESTLSRQIFKKAVMHMDTKPLTKLIEEKYSHPEMIDYMIFTLEKLCDFYHLDSLEIYHLEDVIKIIKEKFLLDYNEAKDLLATNFNKITASLNKETFDDLSKDNLILFFYYHKLVNNQFDFTDYPLFDHELLYAFLLKNICK